MSRRALLRGGLAATGAAVAATAPSACASMPRGGGAPTAHACTHRFCRYHADADGDGRCTLALRVAGGAP